jgi:hypothetical protein
MVLFITISFGDDVSDFPTTNGKVDKNVSGFSLVRDKRDMGVRGSAKDGRRSRFTERISDGLIRHPSFQGLREDKRPKQVVREIASAEISRKKRR